MVELVRRKRLEVVADAPLCEWIAESAAKLGIAHFSVVSLTAGSGQGGAWRDEDLSGAVAKRMFIAVASEQKAVAFIDALAPRLDEYGLLATLSDVDVVRGERF